MRKPNCKRVSAGRICWTDGLAEGGCLVVLLAGMAATVTVAATASPVSIGILISSGHDLGSTLSDQRCVGFLVMISLEQGVKGSPDFGRRGVALHAQHDPPFHAALGGNSNLVQQPTGRAKSDCLRILPDLPKIKGRPGSQPSHVGKALAQLSRAYFLAQKRTAGGPTSGPPLHSMSRSPIEVGNVLAPQTAEIANSSSPQPPGQPPDRQSRRRIAATPAGPWAPAGPASPVSPFSPLSPLSPLRP